MAAGTSNCCGSQLLIVTAFVLMQRSELVFCILGVAGAHAVEAQVQPAWHRRRLRLAVENDELVPGLGGCAGIVTFFLVVLLLMFDAKAQVRLDK